MGDWLMDIDQQDEPKKSSSTHLARLMRLLLGRSSTTESDYGSDTQWLGVKNESVYAFPETTFSDSFYIDLIGSWFCKFVLIQGGWNDNALRKTTVDKTLVIKYKTQPKKEHREKKNSSTVVLQLLKEHVRKTVKEFFFSLLFFLESFFVLIY